MPGLKQKVSLSWSIGDRGNDNFFLLGDRGDRWVSLTPRGVRIGRQVSPIISGKMLTAYPRTKNAGKRFMGTDSRSAMNSFDFILIQLLKPLTLIFDEES